MGMLYLGTIREVKLGHLCDFTLPLLGSRSNITILKVDFQSPADYSIGLFLLLLRTTPLNVPSVKASLQGLVA